MQGSLLDRGPSDQLLLLQNRSQTNTPLQGVLKGRSCKCLMESQSSWQYCKIEWLSLAAGSSENMGDYLGTLISLPFTSSIHFATLLSREVDNAPIDNG